MGVCDLWKHFHFDRKKLYECEGLWNRIVKGVKIFILKGFGVIHVKFYGIEL